MKNKIINDLDSEMLFKLPIQKEYDVLQSCEIRRKTLVIKISNAILNSNITKQLNISSHETLLVALATVVYRYCNKKIINIPLINNRVLSKVDINFDENRNFINALNQLQRSTTHKISASAVRNSPFVVTDNSILEEDKVFRDYKGILISVCPQDKDIILNVNYIDILFDRKALESFFNHVIKIICCIVDNPYQDINFIDYLTEEEKHEIFLKLSDTRTSYPDTSCIGELFEQQVKATPNNIAVVCPKKTLTYKELNQRVNQLAHYLKEELSIKEEDFIGLCIPKSSELIIGILAIIKAGGVYVPIDPEYPANRISHIIEDTKMHAILTTEETSTKLQEHNILLDNTKNINVEHIQCELSNYNTSNPITSCHSENLAYINYTSGSTGKPKGVCIPHKGIVRLTINNTFIDISETDVFLQLSSISFDAATFEIWGCLLNGAKLIIPSNYLSLNELADVLDYHEVSILWLTAGLFHQIVDENLQILNKVKKLLAGGDVLSVNHVRKVINTFPTIHFLNGYGPTENTTFTCTYKVNNLDTSVRSIPIGKPISNTTVLILDKNGLPVPIGVPGELYVGGDGLARGYLNLPQKNKESFVKSIYNTDNDSNLYKTGDLVKLLEDGNIVFIGRVDNQVKIRGFRIELDEVHLALSRYESINKCLVKVCYDGFGEKNLVAYFTSNEEINSVKIRGFLEQILPKFMIPSLFVQVNEFPLNKNGKVDKEALPNPYSVKLSNNNSVDDIKRNTATENEICSIWKEVLQVNTVNPCDNFFYLGGHSLKVMRILSKINKRYNVNLSMYDFFENPTVSGLLEKIHTSNSEDIKDTAISTIADKESPLSVAQEQMLLMDEMQFENPAYNVVSAYKLRGRIDIEVLEKSINLVIQRHEILRTYYDTSGYTPLQKSIPNHKLKINYIDLSTLLIDRKQECDKLLLKESRYIFNLSSLPLLRVTLVRTELQEYMLLLVAHHIAFDGWSLGIFYNEVSQYYLDIIMNKVPDTPLLQTQYKDFSVWQRDLLNSQAINQQLNYWKDKLNGANTYLELPTDFPRPAMQEFIGKYTTWLMDTELSKKINIFSKERNITPYIVLMSAYKLLLSIYSKQTDIVIGTQVTGRTNYNFESLIGYFVNNIVIRTVFTTDLTCETILQKVQSTVLEAYKHQDLPFSALVKELAPNRDASYNPIFQAAFVLQNFDQPVLNIPDTEVIIQDVDNGTAKFDLNLIVEERNESYLCKWEYNTHLFLPETIQRMINNFKDILEKLLSNPNGKISDICNVSIGEQDQLLNKWNDTHKDFPQPKLLNGLLDKQVTENPDKVAVRYKNEELSFKELHKKANQISKYLKSLGLSSDKIVAIYFDKSIDTVVSILGILKVGAAYLPIDSSYPIDRCKFMIEDSECDVLITSSKYKKNLTDFHKHIVCIDENWDLISTYDELPLQIEINEEDTAYIIYTSGSTGEPKGVKVPHRAIYNHMMWMQDTFPITSNDIVIQKTPLSFDASVWEFLAPLLTGATLLLAEQGKHIDPEYLAGIIQQEKVTILQVVPTLLQMLLLEPKFLECISLKRVFCGGEELTPNLAEQFFKGFNIDLINLYGPTEACIDSTYFICSKNGNQKYIPIGRPIDNVKIYILDKDLHPVPIGVSGDIYISGEGLSTGYYNRPILNKERFIPNPFDDSSKSKIYKTGDVGKYLSDGNIVYVGRSDRQVKVRGHRIELGEIQSIINMHSQVKDTVIVTTKDKMNIIAFVISNNLKEILDLDTFMYERLPKYMIPSHIIYLEDFPTTPNGKIDIQNLLSTFESYRTKNPITQPMDEIEKQIYHIWCNLLEVSSINVHQSFFQLGGHSLLAYQLVIALNEKFNIKISLRDIFEFSTVESLAKIIKQKIQEISLGTEGVMPSELKQEESIINLDNLSEEEIDLLLAQLVD
ncbi:non-ribosomal peptide synthetase [Bacillus sp. 196mf]|uniref:non-ribosomal peptide synthetase n=1 Tax=Bacillus sp. 196mf TaxID=1761754 RepID=UPI000D7BD3ED|nr:non-ribosomal peptide synthetase [Bacillus sp. 196mf]PYE91524.1 amino acid adenylation domain-containing protein [Bacillus sp. 196mf]